MVIAAGSAARPGAAGQPRKVLSRSGWKPQPANTHNPMNIHNAPKAHTAASSQKLSASAATAAIEIAVEISASLASN